MTRIIYLLRYYDYDFESGYTCGAFSSMTDVLAYLVEYYDGEVELEKITEPEADGFYKIPRTEIKVKDGDYGERLVLERLEVEATD